VNQEKQRKTNMFFSTKQTKKKNQRTVGREQEMKCSLSRIGKVRERNGSLNRKEGEKKRILEK
jgi:hypothetical protein